LKSADKAAVSVMGRTVKSGRRSMRHHQASATGSRDGTYQPRAAYAVRSKRHARGKAPLSNSARDRRRMAETVSTGSVHESPV